MCVCVWLFNNLIYIHTHTHICMYECMYVCVCMRVCSFKNLIFWIRHRYIMRSRQKFTTNFSQNTVQTVDGFCFLCHYILISAFSFDEDN